MLSACLTPTLGRAEGETPAQAIGLFEAGRVLDAINALEHRLAAGPTPAGREGALSWLVSICAAARERGCLQTHVPTLLDVASSQDPPNPRTRALALYGLAVERVMARDFAFFEKPFTPDFAIRLSDP